jgi:hypothetical protein
VVIRLTSVRLVALTVATKISSFASGSTFVAPEVNAILVPSALMVDSLLGPSAATGEPTMPPELTRIVAPPTRPRPAARTRLEMRHTLSTVAPRRDRHRLLGPASRTTAG